MGHCNLSVVECCRVSCGSTYFHMPNAGTLCVTLCVWFTCNSFNARQQSRSIHARPSKECLYQIGCQPALFFLQCLAAKVSQLNCQRVCASASIMTNPALRGVDRCSECPTYQSMATCMLFSPDNDANYSVIGFLLAWVHMIVQQF